MSEKEGVSKGLEVVPDLERKQRRLRPLTKKFKAPGPRVGGWVATAWPGVGWGIAFPQG